MKKAPSFGAFFISKVIVDQQKSRDGLTPITVAEKLKLATFRAKLTLWINPEAIGIKKHLIEVNTRPEHGWSRGGLDQKIVFLGGLT